MAHLEEFYDYKNRLMEDLLTNDTIVDLIKPTNKTITDPTELVYTQVFPYEYLPDTIDNGETFILCDVDINNGTKAMTLTAALYIWIITHKSNMRLPEGGVRTDKICSEICKTIDGSKFYGQGELKLYSVQRFAPTTDYQGKVMTFYARDIKMFNDLTAPVPTNRRNP